MQVRDENSHFAKAVLATTLKTGDDFADHCAMLAPQARRASPRLS